MEDENFEMEIVAPEDMEDESEDDNEDNEDNEAEKTSEKEVYLPSKQLKSDEELVCDESAYIMLHQASTGAPCLSFDIICDELGNDRSSFPMTAYVVAGTQSARTHVNNLIVMKMDNLYKTQPVDENAEENAVVSDDEDVIPAGYEIKTPQLTAALIKHQGCVNRVRYRSLGTQVFASSWSELGRVHIWNISKELQVIEDKDLLKAYERNASKEEVRPTFTFSGHQGEGFAMDWSPCYEGVLATGDCK